MLATPEGICMYMWIRHKNASSLLSKHHDNEHAGAVPDDLLSRFKVLKNAETIDCLINEMLYIK